MFELPNELIELELAELELPNKKVGGGGSVLTEVVDEPKPNVPLFTGALLLPKQAAPKLVLVVSFLSLLLIVLVLPKKLVVCELLEMLLVENKLLLVVEELAEDVVLTVSG